MSAPTIIRGMSPEDYHAHSALSRSRLKTLVSGTPLDFREAPPVEESAAMRLGTAAHLAILEPDRFAALVRPMPDFGDGRTKAAKEAKAAWLDTNPGKIAVPAEDYCAAAHAAKLIRQRTGPATALARGDAEVSMFWTQDGVDCKSRPDFADFDRRIVCDVKTTQRGLDDRQVVSILVDQYAAMQAAMVNCATHALRGHGVTPYLLVVRLVEPVDVRLVLIDEDWLAFGESQFLAALKVYRECVAQNHWPGWAERDVTTVPMPTWLAKRAEALHIDNARPEEAA